MLHFADKDDWSSGEYLLIELPNDILSIIDNASEDQYVVFRVVLTISSRAAGSQFAVDSTTMPFFARSQTRMPCAP